MNNRIHFGDFYQRILPPICILLCFLPNSLNSQPLKQQITFSSFRKGLEIWTLEPGASNKKQLTFSGRNYNASWSPDGSRFVCATYEFGGWKLGIWDANIGDIHKLTLNENPFYEDSPAWSPDGNKIAFVGNVAGAQTPSNVYIFEIATGTLQKVTDTDSEDLAPSWVSSQRLIFTSNRSGNFEIYSPSTDGKQISKITNHSGFDGGPGVSRDGSIIAFYSDRSGRLQLYLTNVDGSNPKMLTDNPDNPKAPTKMIFPNIAYLAARRGHLRAPKYCTSPK